MEIIFVAGLSGSGKSSVTQVCSELRFTIIEGVSADIVEPILKNLENDDCEHVCVVITEDTEKKFNEYMTLIYQIENDYNIKLLHITANQDVLLTRYKELRKLHPLQVMDSSLSLSNAIEIEEAIQELFIKKCDYAIDTSYTSITDTRNGVKSILKMNESKITVNVLSFGVKNGAIKDADFVFDVRFLPNPYYIKELRPLSGLDDDVYEYVFSFEEANKFYEYTYEMIKLAIDGFKEMKKMNVTIAFSCTGGQHRSVSFARRLGEHLSDDYEVNIKHLEKNRGNW